jgi:hypothetical protein
MSLHLSNLLLDGMRGAYESEAIQTPMIRAIEFAAPESVALPATIAADELVGRDSVEPGGKDDLVMQSNLCYQRSSRSVIPNLDCFQGADPTIAD